jgi:diketogulonate reductase-like aldo/keto reductase
MIPVFLDTVDPTGRRDRRRLKTLARRRAHELTALAYEIFVAQIERALAEGRLNEHGISNYMPEELGAFLRGENQGEAK